MGLSYISHKGKKILYIDYSQCKDLNEMLSVLEEVKNEFVKTTDNFLTLNDFNNTFGSKDFMRKANQYGKLYFDNKTEKSAVLGITGVKKILLKAYNKFVKNKQVPFESKEKALDYLAE